MSIFQLVREAEANEPTEVEKLEIAEALGAKNDKLGFLADAVKENQEQTIQKETKPEIASAGFGGPSESSGSYDSGGSDEESSGDEEGGDDDFGDFDDMGGDEDGSGDEDNESSDEEDASKDEADDRDSEQAAESVRNYPVAVYAQEGPIWDATLVAGGAVGGWAIAAGKKVGTAAFDGAKALALLGIAYSPTIFRHIKKTVVYLFIRTVRSYLGLRQKLVRHLRLSSKRIKKQDRLIAKLTLAVKDLQPREGRAELSMDAKLVDMLSLGGQFAPLQAAQAILKLAKGANTALIAQTVYEVDQLEHLLSTASSNSIADLGKIGPLLSPKALGSDFVRVTDRSYAYNRDLLDLYGYKDSLPGNRRIVMTVPSKDLVDVEELSNASQQSVAFLGMKPNYTTQQGSVDYMEQPQLERFMALLTEINAQLVDNQERLRQAGKRTDSLKLGYRTYFDRLYSSEDRASVSDSMVELVYAKQAFINRVYLPCAMDLHSYILSFVTQATRYGKLCVK